MTATRPTTPAVGGERLLPVPDPIARDYLLLALRLDQRLPGLVDAYFGPADLKAQVDLEQPRSPAGLAGDADDLGERVRAEVDDPARRRWLQVQLVALGTHARTLAGDALPYLDHVERCFDFRPQRRSDDRFREVAARLEALVPGRGPLVDRIATLDESLVVPPDRVLAIANHLVDRFRAGAAELFGLPAGESVRVGLVRDQPWSGYNWYDGGLRSRVDLNVDLPVRAPDLVHVIAHETYPGHHLEHSWKEADLVLRQGRLESSVLLINAPECLISEGLADLGRRFVVPPSAAASLLADVADRADLAMGESAAERAAWADRRVEVATLRSELAGVGVNAAFLRHVDGRSHEEVAGYLRDVGLMSPQRAEKRLEFIERPLWRTYIFVYTEGEDLLRRWLGEGDVGRDGNAGTDLVQVARFARLLHEQLTPGQIVGEIGEIGEIGEVGEVGEVEGPGGTQPAGSSRTKTARSSPSPS